MPVLTLYSTDHCGLCEALLDALLQAPLAGAYRLQVLDVAADDELLERYGLRIPVLMCGNEEYTGSADANMLEAWLASLNVASL